MIAFSVVIPVYNKQAFIQRTLESVLVQTHPDFELLLVNDGSTDGSLQVIEPFLADPRVKLINQENRGASAARNAGIAQASKPYIALLDADDIWYPEHLETLASSITAFPDESVFANNSHLQEGSNKRQRNYSVATANHKIKLDFFEASCIDSVINSSTVAIKKELLKAVGGFDESLSRTEDTDLWIRVGAKVPVVFDPAYNACVIRDKKGLSQQRGADFKTLDFEKFATLEAENAGAKKFLDLNRYSLALEAKLQGDSETARALSEKITLSNLNSKQRKLLGRSAWELKILYKIKEIAARSGIGLSAYK
ncbi:glycosyltransferase family 2 protein [Gilvibacter sediminis]|uniref:glycosyltransferase family 2 protein n=1 Tax=Gilvibacter sediminis TaxID=379071 RepID=UPI0023509E9A|nr:glycosyltransferase family A protein [Gilvibacter sediminis]MDC7998471.1 glycosyltransferase family A protein [Gilvibacter sediminis]